MLHFTNQRTGHKLQNLFIAELLGSLLVLPHNINVCFLYVRIAGGHVDTILSVENNAYIAEIPVGSHMETHVSQHHQIFHKCK